MPRWPVRRAVWFWAALVLLLATGTVAEAQLTFQNIDWPGEDVHSGGPVGFTDVDNNGWDDLILLDEGRHLVVMFQSAEGWRRVDVGEVGDELQWGACVSDFDGDGCKDWISGGLYDGVHAARLAPSGEAVWSDLADGLIFMQGCALVDLDGDGVLDFFACDDDGPSRLWKGQAGDWPIPAPDLVPLTAYDPGAYPDTDHSGNYSVVATDIEGDGDLDLHIAKCRQFVSDPQDPRRINQMWVSDGQGGWTEEAADRGLVLNQQSWTADFGDIDNDGDLDALVTNHSTTLSLLENDGTGHFTDITAGSGLFLTGFFLQAKLADFDNDGHLDCLTSGGTGAQYFLLGNGDGTFTELDWPFSGPSTALGFAVGDVERDGDLDVVLTHGNAYVNPNALQPDRLHLNAGNGHHWIAFDLQGIASNPDAVGARVTLHGAWGIQVREVRGGESYGATHTHHVHFGLGQATAVDSAVIRFPGGMVQTWVQPEVDAFHTVLEAPCTLDVDPEAALAADTLCPGQALDLSVSSFLPGGEGSVRWNTGDTLADIAVAAPGSYRAVVVDTEGCAGLTPVMAVVEAGVSVPVIEVIGNAEACDGEPVVLACSQPGAKLWSNGATTDSITVSVSGNHHVVVEDACGNGVSSDTVSIVRHPFPPAPQLETVIVDLPDSVVLGPVAPTTHWFASWTATDPLAVDSAFVTPVLEDNTLFWVEDQWAFGTETASGGAPEPGPGDYLNTGDFWLVFDAHRDFVLDSVTVLANGAGERTIALVDADGAVVDERTVDLPDGPSRVGLGMAIPEGQGWGLRCLDLFPQLWRDGTGSALEFPYAVGTLATIVSNNLASAWSQTGYYYFFYDWLAHVDGVVCASERVPVGIEDVAPGCTYSHAFNFEPFANVEDGSCLWIGCTDPLALNYHPANQLENGGCIYPEGSGLTPCPSDLDGNGEVGVTDLLFLLSDFGAPCIDIGF